MGQFDKLKEQLEEQKYPLLYMFKFIGPPTQVSHLKVLFETAEVSTRDSRNGKYISFTAKMMMMNAADIIEIYEEAAKLEGVVAL